MADLPNTNAAEMDRIKEIAAGSEDGPVLMLNLNRYVEEAAYPDGELYLAYRKLMADIVAEVGGRILWRTSANGRVVGDLEVHEVLGIWYPSHQAFLDLANAPSSDENMRLRARAVQSANLLRCDTYQPQ